MSSDPHKQPLTTSTPLLQEDSLAPDTALLLESQNELKEIAQVRTRSRVHVGTDDDDNDALTPVPSYKSFNNEAPTKDPGRDEKHYARSFAEYTAKAPSSQYADFHTVDWVRDTVRDLRRYKKLDDSNTCMGWIYKQWDAASAWVLVFLVGLASGVMAGAIDLGTAWFVSFRNGICTSDFTLDEYSCCWASNETSFDVEHCHEFAKWSDLFGIASLTGAYFFNYFIYVVIAVIFGFLASSFVKTVAPYASGSGIPEVKTILSGYVIHGYLGKATLTVKSIGMMLAVGAGLSLGKEGPLVHVACCCGNIFSYLFPKYRKNQAKRKEILSAAAAAGVGVAFGAPIGGVLFSLEEVSYYFPLKTLWRAFFCALVAAATLKYLNPYPNGNLVEFYVSYDAPWHLFELFAFSLIGILGGLYGALFIKANVFWSSLRKKYWKKYAIIEVCLVCFGTALLAFPNPFTRADGSEVIRELFSQCGPDTDTDLCRYNLTSAFETGQYHDTQALQPVYNSLWMLSLAIIYKLVTVTFTYGIKIPAGLFIPSMYAGACVGRIMGVLMEQAVYANRESYFIQFFCPIGSTCIVPGLYAMVGAAAFLGGVTRMTVSLVVIMFELTGGLPYIVPIMLAALFSKWVGDYFSEGIYDEHIKLNRYPFIEAKERYTFDAQASDIMSPQPHQHPLVYVSATESTVGDLEELLDTYDFWGFPVVMTNESQLLMGYVTHMELQEALNTMRRECGNIDPTTLVHFLPPNEVKTTSGRYLNFYSLLDTTQFQVTPITHMYNVVELFKKIGLRQIIITHNGKVTGIITKKDIVKHLEEIEHHHESQAIMRFKSKIQSIFF